MTERVSFALMHLLSELHCIFIYVGVSCIVWYRRAPSEPSCASSARAPRFEPTHCLYPISLTMPPSLRSFVLQIASQVVRCNRHLSHVIAMHARAIVVGVMMETVEQTHRIMVNMANRCVSTFSHFSNIANTLQGEHDVCYSREGGSREPQHLGHAPRARRVCTCRVSLQGGGPPQPCRALLGENGKFLFFLS